MSEKMMKIGGKTTDGIAKAVCVDSDGNVCVKRVWESQASLVFDAAITDTEMHNTLGTPVDLTEWGMASIRINNKLDSAVTFYIYDDVSAASSSWMVDSNGEYPQFTVPAGKVVIFTEADLPVLNYLRHLKFRFKASAVPTSGTLQIYVMAKR